MRVRFTDVTFDRFYPPHEVAEHEVFMSFVNDAGALAFQTWWDEEGAALFQEYLQARSRSCPHCDC